MKLKKYLTFSNVLLVALIFLYLHKPSRIWLTRQLSFSPQVMANEKTTKITAYYWALEGLNTTDVNFLDYQGKVIFLNFWATWCPPCVAEMPDIQAFYNDYKDKVVFVLVSNENWSEINTFFKANNYSLPVYNANGALAGIPRINSIPRTFVIDKSGNIVVDKAGAANWNSDSFRKEIDALLK